MRYIGSKTKMLDVLKKEILSYSKLPQKSIFCDLFAGTGAVGDYFQDKYQIISNDNLYFSYCINRAKLCKNKCSFEILKINPFDYFNNCDTSDYIDGYCYNNFSPKANRQYFSEENSKKIDFIRDTIQQWYLEKKINLFEHDYLIGCLIESLSKVANVAGVYAAFLHIWDSRANKKMEFIDVETINTPAYDNKVFNENSNELIKQIEGDILYIDPPYTTTQYISQYHVLETIARNDKPKHHGIGAHRDNGTLISNWSKKNAAPIELYSIMKEANFSYLAMSYSDAGIMSKEFIESVFKRICGNEYMFKKVDYVKYKNTRALNREIREDTKDKKHYEYLFLGKKQESKYNSPLNYIGGKYDVLDFILSKFPKNIDTLFDLFGGGGTITINSKAPKIIYNDINFNVVKLLDFISKSNPVDLYNYIQKTIKKFNLSKGNKQAYNAFRNYYNSQEMSKRNPLDLYILICYGFEHQIRYNSKMEFNNPCGNSGFNDEMLEKLISFSLEAKDKNISFYSKDYASFENDIKSNDFVYCDPPYLLTCGAYNDGKRGFNGWGYKQQEKLLKFLDRLGKRHIKFALSYIVEHNGTINDSLINWINNNKYHLYLNNEVTKRNRQDRKEALITNY